MAVINFKNIAVAVSVVEYSCAIGSSAILRFSLKSSYKNAYKHWLSHSCKSELCIKVTLNPRKRSNYTGLGQMHSVTQVTLTQCIKCRISKHFYV